jgi:hypothetical protein
MSGTKATVFALYAGVGEITMEFEFRLCGAWDSPIPPAQEVPPDMPRQSKTRIVFVHGIRSPPHSENRLHQPLERQN